MGHGHVRIIKQMEITAPEISMTAGIKGCYDNLLTLVDAIFHKGGLQ